MQRIILGLALWLWATAIPAFAQGASAPPEKPLRLGVVPYLSTRILIATYEPLAAALEHSLSRRVLLQTAPDMDTYTRRAFGGDYDLLLIAPHYARLAQVDYGYVPLLVHKNNIRSLLVTSRDAPLKSLEDLRGQTVAINERSAMVPLLGIRWLADHGLEAGRDYHLSENITQTSALQSVVSGKSRAAIVSYSTLIQATDLQKDAQVFTETYGAPGLFFMAHRRLSPALDKAIRTALLRFEQSPQGQAFFTASTHGGYRAPDAADARMMDKILPETRRLLAQ